MNQTTLFDELSNFEHEKGIRVKSPKRAPAT